MKELVNITNRGFDRERILEYEMRVLSKLQFDINVPTLNRFIQRFCQLIESDITDFYLASYFGELSMLKLDMYQWKPSLTASACIFLARKMMRKEVSWPQILQDTTGYSGKQAKDSARIICKAINKANVKNYYFPIYRKYRQEKLLRVSKIPIDIKKNAQKDYNKVYG